MVVVVVVVVVVGVVEVGVVEVGVVIVGEEVPVLERVEDGLVLWDELLAVPALPPQAMANGKRSALRC